MSIIEGKAVKFGRDLQNINEIKMCPDNIGGIYLMFKDEMMATVYHKPSPTGKTKKIFKSLQDDRFIDDIIAVPFGDVERDIVVVYTNPYIEAGAEYDYDRFTMVRYSNSRVLWERNVQMHREFGLNSQGEYVFANENYDNDTLVISGINVNNGTIRTISEFRTRDLPITPRGIDGYNNIYYTTGFGAGIRMSMYNLDTHTSRQICGNVTGSLGYDHHTIFFGGNVNPIGLFLYVDNQNQLRLTNLVSDYEGTCYDTGSLGIYNKRERPYHILTDALFSGNNLWCVFGSTVLDFSVIVYDVEVGDTKPAISGLSFRYR